VAVKIPKIKKKKSFGARLTAAAMGLAALAIIAFWGFQLADMEQPPRSGSQRQRLAKPSSDFGGASPDASSRIGSRAGESFQEERLREQGYKNPEKR